MRYCNTNRELPYKLVAIKHNSEKEGESVDMGEWLSSHSTRAGAESAATFLKDYFDDFMIIKTITWSRRTGLVWE